MAWATPVSRTSPAQVRHVDLGKVVERGPLRAGGQPGGLAGGGLVGVVLDTDDLAVPHGQHLPQPLLAGRVAMLVTPLRAHVEDDLVAGLDGLAEVGPDAVVRNVTEMEAGHTGT